MIEVDPRYINMVDSLIIPIICLGFAVENLHNIFKIQHPRLFGNLKSRTFDRDEIAAFVEHFHYENLSAEELHKELAKLAIAYWMHHKVLKEEQVYAVKIRIDVHWFGAVTFTLDEAKEIKKEEKDA